MRPGDCAPSIMLAALGVCVLLGMTSEEANNLTPMDLAMLQGDLGMSDDMLAELRDLARVPGRHLRLDFERQRIAIVS